MEKIRVSIILPVYNREKFISAALDSTTKQGLDNTELIIVNDGSNDESEKIIDAFVRSHPFAKKINQPNQGVSAARNHGLIHAKGEYIAFLDSDDEFCDNALKKMYALAKEKDADMVIGASVMVTEFKEIAYKNSDILSQKTNIAKDDPALAYNFSVCNKLFKRQIIADNQLEFKKLKHAEDGLFLFEFLDKCDIITGAQMPVYRYYHRLSAYGSSTVKSLDRSKYEDVMTAIAGIEKITESWSDEFKRALKTRVVNTTLIIEYYRQLWKLDDDTFEMVINEINERKIFLDKGSWEEIVRITNDIEFEKGIKTKQDIADKPLLSIMIPSGHTNDDIKVMIDSLYDQNYPDFEICMDDPYRNTADEFAGNMLNIRFFSFQNTDAVSLFTKARGEYCIFVDVPCVFPDNYLRGIVRRMLVNGRTFASAKPYSIYNDGLSPVSGIVEAFGAEADKIQRKSESSRIAFSSADKYLSNKIFKKDRMLGLFKDEKITLDVLQDAAYKKCSYIRYSDSNTVFFSNPVFEGKEYTKMDTDNVSLIFTGQGHNNYLELQSHSSNDSSVNIVPPDEDSGSFDDKEKMLSTLDRLNTEWVIFSMPGFEWSYESIKNLQSYISASKEMPGSCVCKRIYQNDEKHINDHIFKYGDRTTDIFDQPRAMIDSFCNTAVRTEVLKDVIAGLDKDVFNEYTALYSYIISRPKFGVADSVHVSVSDKISAEETENTDKDRFTFEVCSELYKRSVVKYGRILPFIQHAALYHLKDSNAVDEIHMNTLISRMNEDTMKKSKYYTKGEKNRMSEKAFGLMEDNSAYDNKNTTHEKSSARRAMHYFSNLVTAAFFIVISRILGIFCKIKNNKVLFISDTRYEIGGNFAAVSDFLDDDRYDKRFYLKADRRDWTPLGKWLRFVYDMCTSSRIILEDYFRYTSYYKVRRGQQICQLWHAAGAYKKFGYSRLNDGEGIRIHKGYRKYGKAITSADSIIPNYAEAFGIGEDKIRATGTPRTDVFFNEEYVRNAKERVYEKYPVLRDKKVILFAPTYRGLRAEEADYDIDMLDLDRIHDELGEEYVFVFKWHPAMYNNIVRNKAYSANTEMYSDFYIDLSGEKDIEELMLVSEIMITDYSSVIFDYFLLDKPVVFFAYDIDIYADGRGWYYPVQEYMYGPLARTGSELISAIKNADSYIKMRKQFGKKFMEACDGRSAEKTCDWIFGDIDL